MEKIVMTGNKSVGFVEGKLESILSNHNSGDVFFIISDENVFSNHSHLFSNHNHFILSPGEVSKNQQTVDSIIGFLLSQNAGRNATIIGIGGGVVTDITGFAASIYKRGINLILVPTTILAMVDAAIGGKNGINFGGFKNMVGTVHQPQQIVFDYSLLKTLPQEEWVSGFAEIIKHACIKDAAMFAELEQHSLDFYQNNPEALANLIQRNVEIKNAVVQSDEHEQGERKLLNFGHTVGHALEAVYHLPHGQAVSLGMVIAAGISEEINGFYSDELERLRSLLNAYQLLTKFFFDPEKIKENILKDKKASGSGVDFILLNKIGDGLVKRIGFEQLFHLLDTKQWV